MSTHPYHFWFSFNSLSSRKQVISNLCIRFGPRKVGQVNSLISHPENHLKFIHKVSDHNSQSSIMNLNIFSFSGVILHVLDLPKNNKYSSSRSIDPFMITAVLHSSGTFMSGKIMILQKNRDVINIFNCSTTSFYGKGYYYHSQMSRMNAGPQLLWKSL
jgi:hypothetical protein